MLLLCVSYYRFCPCCVFYHGRVIAVLPMLAYLGYQHAIFLVTTIWFHLPKIVGGIYPRSAFWWDTHFCWVRSQWSYKRSEVIGYLFLIAVSLFVNAHVTAPRPLLVSAGALRSKGQAQSEDEAWKYVDPKTGLQRKWVDNLDMSYGTTAAS